MEVQSPICIIPSSQSSVMNYLNNFYGYVEALQKLKVYANIKDYFCLLLTCKHICHAILYTQRQFKDLRYIEFG